MGSTRPTDYIFAELKMAMADKHSELTEALGAAMLGIENRDKELFARQSELNEAHFDLTETRCDFIKLQKTFAAQKKALRDSRASLTQKTMELTEAQALLKKADRTKTLYWEKLKRAQKETGQKTSIDKPQDIGLIARMEALQKTLESAKAKIKSRDGTIEYLTEKLGRSRKQCTILEAKLGQHKDSPDRSPHANENTLLGRMEKAEKDIAMMEGVNRILRQKLSAQDQVGDENCETVQRLFATKA